MGAVEGLGVEGEVLDLFAGTNVVAGGLAPRFRVATNDLQKFSWILGKALLGKPNLTRTRGECEQELGEAYRENYTRLEGWLRPVLGREAGFLESTESGAHWRSYAEFCSLYPYFPLSAADPNNGYSAAFLRPFLKEYIIRRRRDPSRRPYLLFSTYFANAYFGVRQSLQIDSLRYAIDHSHLESAVRDLYLAALIYAASACVSAIGHFAEFLKPRSASTSANLTLERRRDIWSLFRCFVGDVFAKPRASLGEARNYNADYRILLHRLQRSHRDLRPEIIYADPPYFRDQYSRYYHVLETLVLYDYPDSGGIGRYRRDRPASGFSMRSRAEDEFRTLALLSKQLGAELVVSYCDSGMLSISHLSSLLQEAYRFVSSQSIDYSHSSQGRVDKSEKGTRARTEYLLVGTDHEVE